MSQAMAYSFLESSYTPAMEEPGIMSWELMAQNDLPAFRKLLLLCHFDLSFFYCCHGCQPLCLPVDEIPASGSFSYYKRGWCRCPGETPDTVLRPRYGHIPLHSGFSPEGVLKYAPAVDVFTCGSPGSLSSLLLCSRASRFTPPRRPRIHRKSVLPEFKFLSLYSFQTPFTV